MFRQCHRFRNHHRISNSNSNNSTSQPRPPRPHLVKTTTCNRRASHHSRRMVPLQILVLQEPNKCSRSRTKISSMGFGNSSKAGILDSGVECRLQSTGPLFFSSIDLSLRQSRTLYYTHHLLLVGILASYVYW